MSDDPLFDPRNLFARLRFRHLQLLVALDRAGSLRAAAQQLHLTQPALSKALAEVEAAFGAPLFVRLPRGVAPTEQGHAVVRGAAMLLEELGHLGREVSPRHRATVLRIGAPPFVAQGYLPAVLAALAAQAPSVRVQVHEDPVPLLIAHLLEGRLDALVSSYPADLPEAAGPPLRHERLFDMRFTVIAPRGHPAARRRMNRWEDLAGCRWILPMHGSLLRSVVDDAFRRAGAAAPEPAIESISPFTNLQLVRAGLGISAVPGSTLDAAPPFKDLCAVRVAQAIAAGPVALITRASAENPRVALLRAAIARTPAMR